MKGCTMRRICFILSLLLLPSALAVAQSSRYVPPPESKVVRENGKEYLCGELYLANHADTLSLKSLGFKDFEFLGRSVGTVKYRAKWPVEEAQTELPQAVSGIDYTRYDEIFPLEETESPVVEANPTNPDYLPRVRSFDPEFQKFESSRSGPGISLSAYDLKYMSRDEFVKLLRGEYPDYYKKVVTKWPNTRNDREITGTFRTLPVESGPFHKKENVGSDSLKLSGNFQLTPIETTRRSSIQVRDFGGVSSTGTMNWGTSDYQPRDGWRGVGFRPFPTSYPREYRGGIRGRQR